MSCESIVQSPSFPSIGFTTSVRETRASLELANAWRYANCIEVLEVARRTGRFPQLVDPRSSVNGLLLTGSPRFREVSLEERRSVCRSSSLRPALGGLLCGLICAHRFPPVQALSSALISHDAIGAQLAGAGTSRATGSPGTQDRVHLQCQFSIWRRREEVRRHVHERRCLIAEDGTVAALRYDPQRRSRDRA
jgi:hypothetical protein